MARLKIRNVGPVRNGISEGNGFLDFNGLTLFIGNQGSGKSTVAKVFSTMSWIEKALVREDFTPSFICQYNRFKKQLAYQNIQNYLREGSEIEYYGNTFNLTFANEQLKVEKAQAEENYSFPKIMYVPAERNFVSTVDRPDLVKRLPLPLYTFLDEYDAAKAQLSGSVNLPVGNVKFEYRKQNKKSLISGGDFKIDLLEASSGFQSLVPLILVSRYLTSLIKINGNASHKEISVQENKRIREEIDKIYKNENISEEVRQVLLERLSERFSYGSFINVVEEPEQNLYPASQKSILFELLRLKNDQEKNQLVITTHSPYIVNYLTLAVKAHQVKEAVFAEPNRDDLKARLSEVVPLDSTIALNRVNIYQLDENGSIKRLSDQYGIPSDANFLNESLAETNLMYAQLQEIEEEL